MKQKINLREFVDKRINKKLNLYAGIFVFLLLISIFVSVKLSNNFSELDGYQGNFTCFAFNMSCAIKSGQLIQAENGTIIEGVNINQFPNECCAYYGYAWSKK